MEAAEVLRGGGCADLSEVCVALATHLVSLVRNISAEEAKTMVQDCIRSGAAFETMKKWVSAQGGNANALEDFSLLPQANSKVQIVAPTTGYLTAMDTRMVGEASVFLGAGRSKKDDPIDYGAGIILRKKTGDFVKEGECLAEFYCNDASLVPNARQRFLDAITWGDTAPAKSPLIFGIVG
jgi:pyrimidine-nucleoside phosphorylase